LLASCSSDDSGSKESSSGESGSASAPAEISLTAIEDLSGGGGLPGRQTQKGMEVAIDDINKSEFLGSTKLAVEFKDSATDPNTAVSLFTEAVAGDVPLVFGPTASLPAVQAAQVAQKGGLPTVFTQATAPGVVEAGDYIFRVTATLESYTDMTAAFIKKEGWTKMAGLAASDSPVLSGLMTSFEEAAGDYDYEVVDVEKTSAQETSWATQFGKIVDADPDVVMLFLLAGQNPSAVTQLRQAGYDGPIIGAASMASGALKPAGADADGVMWATDFLPQAPHGEAGTKFVDAYKAKFNEEPDAFAAEGYDAVWFAARAFKQMIDDGQDVNDRTAVQSALAKLSDAGFEGALGDLTFKDRSLVMDGVLAKWDAANSEAVPAE
jgi:branched-chain amino acid transport system substrate-binding protein